MGQKNETRPLNVAIPQELSEQIDLLLARRGWIKKRLVGAALMALLAADEADQQDAYTRYYDHWLKEGDKKGRSK